MSAFFVTATGTDIGKTFVAAGMIRFLRSRGLEASGLKPVISGFDPERAAESDSGVLLDAMGHAATQENIDKISPWRFEAPLSPDMAAAREGGHINFGTLVEFSRDAIAKVEGTLFIEGVGGVMTPVTAGLTVLEWIVALRIPAIVVTGSYLGTISHTLTALDVLRRAEVQVPALVVNATEGSPVPLYDTAEAIGRFARGVPVVTIPRHADDTLFAPLAHFCGIE